MTPSHFPIGRREEHRKWLTELRHWIAGLRHRDSDTYLAAAEDGLFDRFAAKGVVLDIGFVGDPRGAILPNAEKICVDATGQLPDALRGRRFDAIIVAGVLENLRNPTGFLRVLGDMLELGGHLIAHVPHRDLYERKLRMPSRWNDAHRRFYTTSALLNEMQAAWGLNGYRLRFAKEYDRGHRYNAPDDIPPVGLYASLIVVEKLPWCASYPDMERLVVGRRGDLLLAKKGVVQSIQLGEMLAPRLSADAITSVCVLKLDHIGDFAMAVPVFHELRAMLPAARITCVCGSWNANLAGMLGIFQDVVVCDYYKQNERDGGNADSAKQAAADQLKDTLADRQFDLAIDLRVPSDSRGILQSVNARYRAGIGGLDEFPFLDIALPYMESFRLSETNVPEAATIDIPAVNFSINDGGATHRNLAVIKPKPNTHFLFGPYASLRRGGYKALIKLVVLDDDPRPVEVSVDVVAGASSFAQRPIIFDRNGTGDLLEFDLPEDTSGIEIRFLTPEEAIGRQFFFAGVQLEHLSDIQPRRLMHTGAVHLKESMALLVNLVRTRLLRSDFDPESVRRALSVRPLPNSAPFFALVPLSNSELRDWPLPQYQSLIEGLLKQTTGQIMLFGAPSQAPELDALVSATDPSRVTSRVGLPWADVYCHLAAASVVVTNNSGMAHLAGLIGANVLSIYSASHQATEWGPIGEKVTVLQAAVECGPCGYDAISECPHGHQCMQMITPELVISELRVLAPQMFKAETDAARTFGAASAG